MRIPTLVRPSNSIGVATLAVILSGSPASGQLTPGFTYVTRYSTVVDTSGPVGSAMANVLPNWSGTTVYAAGRGRTDVTDGQVRQMWEKGDYILFDSTDYIIVHPATKTFFGLPKDMGKALSNMMSSMGGMTMSFSDVGVTLDTLGSGDSIEGYQTQRYRITAKATVNIDMSGLGTDAAQFAPGPMTVTSAIEMWMADNVPLPAHAVMARITSGPAAQAGMMSSFQGGMGDMAAKMSAVRAAIPARYVALKTVMSQTLTGSPVLSGTPQSTMTMTGIKATDADLGMLVLPADYVESAPPAFSAFMAPGASTATADAGAKWRVKPQGG
jgi:hypothetical protein